MNIQQLQIHVAAGLIKEVSHPNLPLTLYNYADKIQYENLWDETTLQCRGLVMHGDKVVARPLRKFFNDTQLTDGQIPWHLSCEITEKMDGSLLIVFHFDGQWHACTRGSFVSEQAVKGLDILQSKYGLDGLNPAYTYCFETLYPANRIVVDYGDREDVILLAVFDTQFDVELPLSAAPPHLTYVRSLPLNTDVKTLRTLIRDDQEGYVVRFSNGFRMKVKGERYLELHKIYAGINSRLVWEHMANHKSLNDILAVCPDEFADWVRRERLQLFNAYLELRRKVESALDEVRFKDTRKEQAAIILQEYRDVSSAVFLALDGKDYEKCLWDKLYPSFRQPRQAEELAL